MLEQVYENALHIAAGRIAATAFALGDAEYALWRDGGSFKRIGEYIQERRLRARGYTQAQIEQAKVTWGVQGLQVGPYFPTKRG